MPTAIRTLTVKYKGDTSSLEKSTTKATKTVGGFGKAFGKVGSIAAGVFTGQAMLQGAEQVGKFLEDATKKAMEDQQSQALLAKTMRNVTGAHKEQIDAVEKLIDRLSNASGVAREDLRPAFST